MASSYNGWPADPDPNAIGIEPFGETYGLPFPGGVKGGDVTTVLGYVAVQLHERVEPCVEGWDWGYNYRDNVNNPGSLSCHASGTAIDYNAPEHPNGASNTFTPAQVSVIREILAEVQGTVQWGGDYSGTTDDMHFEIIVDAGTLARVAATLGTPAPGDTTEDGKVDAGMALSAEALDQISGVVSKAVDERIQTHLGAQAVQNPNAALNAGIMARTRADDNAKFQGVTGYKKV